MGADLSKANLYGTSIDGWIADLVDARGITWEPIEKVILDEMITDTKKWIKDKEHLQRVLERLGKAAGQDVSTLHMYSCLSGPDTLSTPDTIQCGNHYNSEKIEDFEKFKQQLHSSLGVLACATPHIAWGIMQQIKKMEDNSSSRKGLGNLLRDNLDDKECKGLQELSAGKKELLLGWASESIK